MTFCRYSLSPNGVMGHNNNNMNHGNLKQVPIPFMSAFMEPKTKLEALAYRVL